MTSDVPRGWLRLVVPRDNTSAPFTAEQLYAAIHAGTGRRESTQILLAGAPGDVGIWLRAEEHRLDPLAAMVRATYPDAELDPAPPPWPRPSEAAHLAAARWAMAHEAAYPIKTVRAFEHSEPMAMTLGALAETRPGEFGAVSLVLAHAPSSFVRRSLALQRALATGGDTGPLWQRALFLPFDLVASALSGLLSSVPDDSAPALRPLLDADLEARLKWLAGKVAQPAFAVTLRTVWLAPTAARAARGHAGLVSALGQFAVVGQNALVQRREDPRDTWRGIANGEVARRERVVLAIDELAGLVHSPGADLVVPHLRRTGARSRATAPIAPGALHLADTLHRDDPQPVGITVQDLMSHGYVVGPSGTGKTTLLTQLVLSLVDTGTAGIVLDPHGDLVRQVLARIPDDAAATIDLFDLADPDALPTLNPLWVDPGLPPVEAAVARAVRSAAVTAVFADLWGLHRAATPNLLHFLEAALAALIASGDGCLANLPRFLTDGAYRASVVRAADDPRVTARWAEFAALSHDDRSRTVRAILNKAAAFDRNPLLATVFGDPGPGLRLDTAMDGGRVLLVSLPRGLVPEGTVELLGSLLVSLVYQAALAREARPPEERPPVVAVIDEFQEFALSTFAKVVTATRKYGLGLVVANQNLSRVRAVSPDVLETLLANVATLVTFRAAPGDADTLAPFLAPFDANDIAALAPYECYWRVPTAAGPRPVAARTRPLSQPVRDGVDVDSLAGALRVAGRGMRLAERRDSPYGIGAS
jgi:RecA/RadA recombinase